MAHAPAVRWGRMTVAVAAGLWGIVGVVTRSDAQGPTTVQLPTFHSFSVDTSVLVPDRGSTSLGGVDYARSGSTTRGVPGLSHVPGANRLFKNRAFGWETGRSAASVSAWIHDLSAMDAAVLADAAARRGDDPSTTTAADSRTQSAQDVSASSASRGDASLASIRAQQAAQQTTLAHEALDLIRQGDAAAEAGKPGVARLFYQQALRRAPQVARPLVQRRLSPP